MNENVRLSPPVSAAAAVAFFSLASLSDFSRLAPLSRIALNELQGELAGQQRDLLERCAPAPASRHAHATPAPAAHDAAPPRPLCKRACDSPLHTPHRSARQP